MTGHELFDKILTTLWTIFSQMNGNPDYHASGMRFCMAIFFLVLLYATIRMRAMSLYKPHQIVALCGCVLMLVREFSMLVFMCGWELQLYTNLMIHFLWPPIEHTFSLAAFLCFAWYTIEASQWNTIRRFARHMLWPICTFVLAFSIYALITWKHFFTAHYPLVQFSYKDSAVDWQMHAVVTLIAVAGIMAAYMRRRGASYLLYFWIVTLIEHATRTITFAHFQEPSWLATVFHAMHIWAIPLLLLHFINAYVLKMSQCAECKRDVYLGKLYWETMHAPIQKGEDNVPSAS
jgi:hypothetical protein